MQGSRHPDRILRDSATVSGKPDAKGCTARKYQELTTTPQGNLLFTIFAGLSRFERDLITLRKAQLYSGRDIANSYCRTILFNLIFYIVLLPQK